MTACAANIVTVTGDNLNDWTLVTVTYNSEPELREFWEKTDLHGVDWVVVDNGSRDDSVALATSLGARTIDMEANLGFSTANNAALATVTTPWVMFVNPDLRVDTSSLERLALTATTHGGLVAPQLRNPDGSRQPNARGLPFLVDKVANRGLSLPGARLRDYARTDLADPTYVAWVMGAAVGGATSYLRELGGWSEDYFLYYEDHDLGIRSWRQGHPVVLDPAVVWEHGWQRATTGPNFRAWRAELASMRAFYRAHPYLLTRARLDRSGHLRDLRSKLWQPAS